MTHQDQLIAAAKAEDLYNLQQHIAWTDVLRPKLLAEVEMYSKMLVNEALGMRLPDGITREQVAGRAYGINFISNLMEKILKEGERALDAMNRDGITIQHLER